MTTCIPIKDLKDTASFTEAVQSADGPVVVTKNGREAFVSMSMAAYDDLRREAARAGLYRSVERGVRDVREGRERDGHDVVRALREKYGLQG